MESLEVCLSPSCSQRCLTKVPKRSLRIRCMAKQKQGIHENSRGGIAKLGCQLSSGLLAGILFCNNPCFADVIETVPASSVTEYAQPLEKQEIKKGEIWIVFVVGAASLFGGTLLLEKNEKWFPAISKANKALEMASKMQESEEESEEAAPPSSSPGPSFPMQDDQSTAAVEEGLADARLRFEDQQATSQPTTNIPQILSSVEEQGDGSSAGVIDNSSVENAQPDGNLNESPSRTSVVGTTDEHSPKPDASP